MCRQIDATGCAVHQQVGRERLRTERTAAKVSDKGEGDRIDRLTGSPASTGKSMRHLSKETQY